MGERGEGKRKNKMRREEGRRKDEGRGKKEEGRRKALVRADIL